MCLVAAERKRKKNGSTNTTIEPEYYFAQAPCDSVKDDEPSLRLAAKLWNICTFSRKNFGDILFLYNYTTCILDG